MVQAGLAAAQLAFVGDIVMHKRCRMEMLDRSGSRKRPVHVAPDSLAGCERDKGPMPLAPVSAVADPGIVEVFVDAGMIGTHDEGIDKIAYLVGIAIKVFAEGFGFLPNGIEHLTYAVRLIRISHNPIPFRPSSKHEGGTMHAPTAP